MRTAPASSASARAPSGKRSSISPQLPQLLAGVGMCYASFYSQWTWHTPEVPWERIPAVWWEGQDGTRLLTGTRNKLNLHQWPEDFAAHIAGATPRAMPIPGIIKWREND